MAKPIKARCQVCGKEAQVEWSLGLKCPSCGSGKFLPVVRIEKEEKGAKGKRRGGNPKPVGLILAVVLFAAAIAAFGYRLNSTKKRNTFYKTSAMICTNPNCEKIFQKKLLTRNVFPEMRCPTCKQVTAHRAVQCRDCGTIFGLDPKRKPSPTVDLQCPACESRNINFDSSTLELEERP
jgi:DNA-directed RNA polymerase subunit RPC12/RpoP